MYKVTEKLSRVSGIKSFKNELYCTVDGVLKVNGNSIIPDVEGYSFWFIDGGIYFFTEKGERRFLMKDVNHLLPVPLFVGTETEETIFCKNHFRRENRKWKWEVGVFDFTSFNVIRELPFENYTVVFAVADMGIGYYQKNKISAFNIINGSVIWELEFGQLGSFELDKFINIYQNQLLIACSNHLLLSVDVNTGKTLHHWRDLVGFEVGSLYKDLLPNPTNFVLDKNAAKLIGVFDTYYFEIDLDSKEINYHQLKDELSKYGISDFRPFNDNTFTSEHLFLTAHTYLDEFPDVDLSSVLALNRKTKKVDWIHVFKDVGIGTNVPQTTETHLYQLDIYNTLHIFEKENSPNQIL